MERRFISLAACPVKLETREGQALPSITGYGAVFYDGTPQTEFELWDGMRERILPGAFDRAIAEKDDVRGLFNHDTNMILGRTSAKTMTLSIDQRGLKFEIQPPDTQAGRDVVASIKRGDITGSSFMFSVSDETWSKENDLTIREIRGVKPLYDTGPVTFPAYEGTTAGMRSKGDFAEARAAFDKFAKSLVEGNAARQQVNVRADMVRMGLE